MPMGRPYVMEANLVKLANDATVYEEAQTLY